MSVALLNLAKMDRLFSSLGEGNPVPLTKLLSAMGLAPAYHREALTAVGVDSTVDLDTLFLTPGALRDAAREILRNASATVAENMRDTVFDAVTERGNVSIKPSGLVPGCYGLFVVAGAFDGMLRPGEEIEVMALDTERDASKYLACLVFAFLEKEFGTDKPKAKSISRPHLTIIGNMLKALAAVDFIPEHPDTLRAPAHEMAMKSLDALRKRFAHIAP